MLDVKTSHVSKPIRTCFSVMYLCLKSCTNNFETSSSLPRATFLTFELLKLGLLKFPHYRTIKPLLKLEVPNPIAEFGVQLPFPKTDVPIFGIHYLETVSLQLKSEFLLTPSKALQSMWRSFLLSPPTKQHFRFLTHPWIRNQVYSAGQEERCKLDTSGSNSPPHPGKVQIPHPLKGPSRQMPWSSGRGNE